MTKLPLFVLAVVLSAIVVAPAPATEDSRYTVTPLVSNTPLIPAAHVDPHLVNAWGLVASPTSPWWVSDNGTDLSTLYNADGTKRALEVTVNSAPTGIVFANVASNFLVGPLATPAAFIWSTEEGTILGWNGSLGTTAQVKVSNPGAVYKGLAIATTATGPLLYATDFVGGRVDVFDGQWHQVTTPGGFVDPNLPSGYGPFGIQTIGSRIYVGYAKQSGTEDELHGQGLGVVDAFDIGGRLLARVAQHGQLNAPWGLALAPASFGEFGGDLLVGNFGDGRINAYAQQPDGSFERAGGLRDSSGRAIAIDGLWALEFGHGAPSNGPIDRLFFTAGPNDEEDGLFGSIDAT
jgi:uncharacterized protein (TIGR03118 family)